MKFKELAVGKFFMPKSVEGIIFIKLESEKLSSGLRFNSIAVQGDSAYPVGTMLNFSCKEKILQIYSPNFHDDEK